VISPPFYTIFFFYSFFPRIGEDGADDDEEEEDAEEEKREMDSGDVVIHVEVLSLLALLVQKYLVY
jgi:hypothetical protein